MYLISNIFSLSDLLDFQNPAGLDGQKPVGFTKPNRLNAENQKPVRLVWHDSCRERCRYT